MTTRVHHQDLAGVRRRAQRGAVDPQHPQRHEDRAGGLQAAAQRPDRPRDQGAQPHRDRLGGLVHGHDERAPGPFQQSRLPAREQPSGRHALRDDISSILEKATTSDTTAADALRVHREATKQASRTSRTRTAIRRRGPCVKRSGLRTWRPGPGGAVAGGVRRAERGAWAVTTATLCSPNGSPRRSAPRAAEVLGHRQRLFRSLRS